MNPWKRKGLSYTTKLYFWSPELNQEIVILKKLGFISYHLIKWLHGETALMDMASRTNLNLSVYAKLLKYSIHDNKDI